MGGEPEWEAKVQVTLLNGGPGAFEPEKFGGRITVEASFTLSANTPHAQPAEMYCTLLMNSTPKSKHLHTIPSRWPSTPYFTVVSL
jgi:hypothetical protein